ncbi:3-isopropylmalate dehydratase large subunit [Cenarchaeum symbiosum A]|uniref:3-isopropylmalate dehydratase n=1 Tax=Cenarchaeum symbiosum (strain A) TaxID=414004 RepID=A0RXP1_CENSY|nr:3-isopropylmalate dehydratase large subunit [Cenarchaeum symbiosum A]
MARTLFEKIWDSHTIAGEKGGPSLLYIDRHMIHEVTSPQAFDGLRAAGRRVRRPDLTVATIDHGVPTSDRSAPNPDKASAAQIRALEENCREFGVRLFGTDSPDQGIVHVIGPQLGMTLPGATIVCGDSHTSTQGAFGALAFGIGTSDVEHVLASQTVWMEKPGSFEIRFEGELPESRAVTSKDIILSVIREIGTAGGTGMIIEYRGSGIAGLSMEQRMTICNMSIEAGARAGMMAPDERTFEYLRGRRHIPENYEELVEEWRGGLFTDPGASFDRSYTLDISAVAPQVSWGTNPEMTCDVTGEVPTPEEYSGGDPGRLQGARRALEYMDLEPGTPMTEVKVDRVFIGSCTNARLEDLIEASRMVKGRKASSGVRAMVVPGSQEVKRDAEKMGLDRIFTDAGFEWRESGCSMCLGMNPDVLAGGERCASTSNRNFEGRQGAGGRTHLVSPVMAAAAAIEGRFVDVRELDAAV